VRSVVPPFELPIGFGRHAERAAAGADDGDRVLALAVGAADPVAEVAGCRLVAADRGAGGGAAGAGVGPGWARGPEVSRRAASVLRDAGAC